MRRTSITLLALLLAGCTTGLDGAPPLEEAAHKTPPDLVAAVHARPVDTGEDVVVDGRLWVPWGKPTSSTPDDLRPVGSANGLTVYARSWDRSPYEALFAREGGTWQGYAPVLGQTGGTPAMNH